jgi:hypothetical protein
MVARSSLGSDLFTKLQGGKKECEIDTGGAGELRRNVLMW